MSKQSTDTTILEPCQAEGGCPLKPECIAYRLDCLSYRMYVAGRPRIGIDNDACRREPGYRYHEDRGLKRKRLKEFVKEYAKPWKEKTK